MTTHLTCCPHWEPWSSSLSWRTPQSLRAQLLSSRRQYRTTTTTRKMKKLVAARKSSKSSLNDMQSDPTSSVYSCSDSGFYSVSDCSTPPTPSYPARGHLRYPSSTSSLSSSPPTFEPFEAPNASGKLPKLTEEPLEPEEDYVMAEPERFSCRFAMHLHKLVWD